MAANAVIDISDCKKMYEHYYIQYSSKKTELDMAIIKLDNKFNKLLCCINANGYVFSENGYSFPVTQIYIIRDILREILNTNEVNKIYEFCTLLNDNLILYNHELWEINELLEEMSIIILKLKKYYNLRNKKCR